MTTRIAAPEGFERELGPGGLEVRTLPADVLEARAAGDESTPRIVGLGSVYGQTTRIKGWWAEWDEEVAAGAWKNTISRDADIRSMKNHDVNWLLGRTTAGTLLLEDRDEGLWYEVDINPDDPNAMATHAQVSRQDISGSSVWFRVVSERWDEPTDDNDLEVAKRTILEAELFEVGPVTFPAFTQTTVEAASLRAMDVTLQTAGVSQAHKRAAYASDFLADPSNIEAQVRALFARQPNLRTQVCSADAATGTPETVSTASAVNTSDGPSQAHTAARARRLELLRLAG
jgi:hypothetical protein